MRIRFVVSGVWDHKRIVSILREMVLRSGLPFEPAKINKHWPRLAYGPALGYKQESLGEVADLYFSTPVKEAEAQAALVKSAPNGVRVLCVWRVPYALPSVTNLADVMKYSAQGDFLSYTPVCPAEEFFRQKNIYVTVEAPGGMTMKQDLASFILQVAQPQPNRLELFLQRCGEKTAKPEHIVAAWLQVSAPTTEFSLPGIKFIREALYWRDASGELHAI